jgi:HAD superfamily hydrolase (TIGR01484 family)
MLPIAQLDSSRLTGIQGVFTDIDDTISTDGKIRPEVYAALWRLRDAGLRVVPVTGRPAGWCDMIARFWPVDAVVGENGGFYFYHDGSRIRRHYLYDEVERAEFRQRLVPIRERILREVPGCAVAADQMYREYDLAIDFCEDVAPLDRDSITRIQRIFEEHGAHAKISSIHVNGWFGEFDKLSTSRLCARDLFGVDIECDRESFVFCGDSPNDEPMFAFFPLSFGMANLEPFLDRIRQRPAFITERPAGEGFVEVAERILQARGVTK